MEAKHKDITDLIIKAFYTVYNSLGYGFPSAGSGQAWRRFTRTPW